jgi:hypothetical protein
MDKGQFGRRDRLIKTRRHDTYRWRAKPTAGTTCPRCHAVVKAGRWCWNGGPTLTHVVCPACRRIKDELPAGHVDVAGEFFAANRPEIVNLIRNVARRESAEHPLERLMGVVDHDGHATFTTTGIHLARRIGEALSRSYHGELAFAYDDSDRHIQVRWRR